MSFSMHHDLLAHFSYGETVREAPSTSFRGDPNPFTRHRWTCSGVSFVAYGRSKNGHDSTRHFVGPDWSASYWFSAKNADGSVRPPLDYRISRLHFRGNVKAAEEALMEAYLKLL